MSKKQTYYGHTHNILIMDEVKDMMDISAMSGSDVIDEETAKRHMDDLAEKIINSYAHWKGQKDIDTDGLNPEQKRHEIAKSLSAISFYDEMIQNKIFSNREKLMTQARAGELTIDKLKDFQFMESNYRLLSMMFYNLNKSVEKENREHAIVNDTASKLMEPITKTNENFMRLQENFNEMEEKFSESKDIDGYIKNTVQKKVQDLFDDYTFMDNLKDQIQDVVKRTIEQKLKLNLDFNVEDTPIY